jgi:hypothetical protein
MRTSSFCTCLHAPSLYLFAGSEVVSGTLSIAPASIIVKSDAQISLAMKFNASLPAEAAPVKLFTCSAAGDPLQYITELQQTAADGNAYSASLALHGPQLGSLSSSPGVLRFTVVVGDGNRATGATAQLELLQGVVLSEPDCCSHAACCSAQQLQRCWKACSRLLLLHHWHDWLDGSDRDQLTPL